MGAPRLLYVRDRRRTGRGRAVERLQGPRHRGLAGRRCLCVSSCARAVHCLRDLHDWREGGGRDHCGRQRRKAGGMTTGLRRAWGIALAGLVAGAGCSLATSVRKNTDAIQASTDSIRSNTEAIGESTKGTATLVPALQGVERLSGPMQSVASLEPTLRGVAALDAPMTRVAALDPTMRAVAALDAPMTRVAALNSTMQAVAGLQQPMTRVADMRQSLDAVAALRDPLGRVSALDVRLAAVANLGPQLQQVGSLGPSLDRVAALGDPMSRLAGLGSILDRPWLLAGIGLLVLAGWGVVTFLAVRLAVGRALKNSASGEMTLIRR